jgi:bifunctional enzyme CysN/CysC
VSDRVTTDDTESQGSTVVWFTGLSGAGKSTISGVVEADLRARGVRTCLLDGDAVRTGLSSDLGFSDADRDENMRRVAEVAALMADAGLVVLVALISPFQAGRARARSTVAPRTFLEVFVDTPLDVAEARDPKGLYARARRGDLADLTGISSPYEPPYAPELRIDTTTCTPDVAAGQVVDLLRRHGIVP